MKTRITFVNHASICVTAGRISILSDPWYFSSAFHKGWSLLYENSDDEINNIVDNLTHIWISHEHPDHLSIPFFKKYSSKLKKNKVTILFQKTKDRRVVNFLRSINLKVEELNFNKSISLSKEVTISCFKDGVYDSALLIESFGEKILNLNDCVVRSPKEAKKIFNQTGYVDFLATQFSYAAWKGGEKNKQWREIAAEEKINAIEIQNKVFKPKYILPFASFIYFSNDRNFYLNDSVNTPRKITNNLSKKSNNLLFMKPFDVFGGDNCKYNSDQAIIFWEEKFNNIHNFQKLSYDKVTKETLKISYEKFLSTLSASNNLFFMRLVSYLPFLNLFKPLTIELDDINEIVKIDIVKKKFQTSENSLVDLKMSSESLNFIFNNQFGFDTLTVNGCFEEISNGGFVKSVKSIGVSQLNNNGYKFNFRLMFNINLIISSFRSIFRVKKNLE